LDRWASTDHEEAVELQEDAVKAGCCPVSDLVDRQMVDLQGTLKTVTLRPRGGVPALEAELYDGSGKVTVIWLGRRYIAGIQPGRQIRVRGRVGMREKKPILFNPRYELK